MVARLGTPVRLVHRNERTAAERAACTAGTPCVLARLRSGDLQVLLTPQALELGGSVEAFEQAVRARYSESAC
jgi:hypothetical protein